MDAAQRREEIRKILGRSREPVSAATIASEVHVSRQIVVGDIALLRAGGADIQATPRGYILQTQDERQPTALPIPSPAATAGKIWRRSCMPWWTTAEGFWM